MQLDVEYDDSGPQRAFARLSGLTRDTGGLTRRIAGIMHDEVEQNFEEEGRPKWMSLAPRTIKDRQKKGYWPGKILQRRGDLVRSIVPSSTPEEARVSTNKVYARILHLGGVITRYARSGLRAQKRGGRGRFKKGFEKTGRGSTTGQYEIHIDARPFMMMTPGGVQKVLEAGRAWLRRGLTGKGQSE